MLRLFSLMLAGCLMAFGAMAQTTETYDGSQDLRPTFMGTAYDVTGGSFDGKRGFLFRIWNREGVPVELSTIPDSFNQPILGFLSVGAEYTNGVASFEGQTTSNALLFDGSTETLNPSPTGAFADRPANFIAIVEPTVDTLVFTLRNRTATASYAAATVETLDLGSSGDNVTLNFVLEEDGGNTDPSTIQVEIDGQPVASPEASGLLSLNLAPGTYSVVGLVPNTYGGRTTITVEQTGSVSQTFVMSSEGLFSVEDYDLRLASGDPAIVSISDSEVRLQFADPDTGTIIPLERVDYVEAIRIVEGSFDDFGGRRIGEFDRLNDLFTLDTDGSLVTTDVAGFLNRLQSLGEGVYAIEIMGSSFSRGVVFRDTVELNVAKFTLNGSIQTLPSSPSYSVENVSVELQSLSSNQTVSISPDVSGLFDFGEVVTGIYRLAATIDVGGETLTSDEIIVIDANSVATMTPLSLAQRQNDEVDFSLSQTAPLALATTSVPRSAFAVQQRLGEMQTAQTQAIPGPAISIFSDFDERDPEARLTVEVDDLADEIVVLYRVDMTFIGDLLIRPSTNFPDRWSLNVYDDVGANIFFDGSRFESSLLGGDPQLVQTSSFPGFDPDMAESGLIIQKIPIVPITDGSGTGTREFLLEIALDMSIFSEADAFVEATLIDDPADIPVFTLEVALDGVPQSNAPDALGRGRDISGRLVSIPQNGEQNTFDYRLPIRLTSSAPGDVITLSDINSIRVDLLLGTDGSEGSFTIFDEAASASQIEAIAGEDGLFELQVAFVDNNGNSPANGDPPEASNIQYEVGANVTIDGQIVEAEFIIPARTGLWISAEQLPSHGIPEAGSDKWAHYGVHRWIDDNVNLLDTSINDISAEHARPFRGGSHSLGIEMDTRFFGEPNDDGRTVLRNLQANVIDAISGDVAAEAAARAFVEAQRDALEDLFDEDVFRLIIGPYGPAIADPANPGMFLLEAGWASSLYRNGTVTVDGVVVLDIGGSLNIGAGDDYDTNNGHDDHYHLSFLPAQLEQGP
ncbi:MAG: hypothetical protein AAGF33_00485 [Pseudomonadota bacterium]